MAKSLSQVNLERDTQASEGHQVNDQDVELAFRMAVEMLEDGGLDIIKQAIDQSTDPAAVVGQFLAQMIGELGEGLEAEYDIDPRIFLAKNGWLDLILDYIEGALGYPDSFSDEIYQQVVEVIKAAASSPDAPNNVMNPEADDSRATVLPPQPAQPSPGAMPSQGGFV